MKKHLVFFITIILVFCTSAFPGSSKNSSCAPAKVNHVSAVAGHSSVIINWKKVSGATKYYIYKFNSKKDKYEYIGSSKTDSFTVKNLNVHKTYKFRIRPVAEINGTAYKGVISETIKAKTKYSPADIKNLKSYSVKEKSLTLKWSSIPDISEYRIYKYNTKSEKYEKIGSANVNKFTVFGLKSNTKYTFKVNAVVKANNKTYIGNGDKITIRTVKKITESVYEENNPKIKYVDISGGNNDGAISGNKIIVYIENVFGDRITAKSGNAIIDYGSDTYNAECKVNSYIYAGNQIQIEIGMPSSLKNAIENGSTPFAYVTLPKGLIIGSDNVSNKQVRVTIGV